MQNANPILLHGAGESQIRQENGAAGLRAFAIDGALVETCAMEDMAPFFAAATKALEAAEATEATEATDATEAKDIGRAERAGSDGRSRESAKLLATASVRDDFTREEIFGIIRKINDPEHPLTLEQLNVVQKALIEVDDGDSRVKVCFTPTIPHCSMATLIGLSIRTKLLRSLPQRFKVDVLITPGTHNQERDVNKQLADKERVAAALENPHLLDVVNKCIAHTD